jgi:GT2 family glycosyltransferase
MDRAVAPSSFAEGDAQSAVVGPRLSNLTARCSVRCAGTRHHGARHRVLTRAGSRHARILNSFYGEGFDHRSRSAEFLVGAVLLVRRSGFYHVGGFDPDFFMFNEEVDLCYRLTRTGRRVVFAPRRSSCVGGASTSLL